LFPLDFGFAVLPLQPPVTRVKPVKSPFLLSRVNRFLLPQFSSRPFAKDGLKVSVVSFRLFSRRGSKPAFVFIRSSEDPLSLPPILHHNSSFFPPFASFCCYFLHAISQSVLPGQDDPSAAFPGEAGPLASFACIRARLFNTCCCCADTRTSRLHTPRDPSHPFSFTRELFIRLPPPKLPGNAGERAHRLMSRAKVPFVPDDFDTWRRFFTSPLFCDRP